MIIKKTISELNLIAREGISHVQRHDWSHEEVIKRNQSPWRDWRSEAKVGRIR